MLQMVVQCIVFPCQGPANFTEKYTEKLQNTLKSKQNASFSPIKEENPASEEAG